MNLKTRAAVAVATAGLAAAALTGCDPTHPAATPRAYDANVASGSAVAHGTVTTSGETGPIGWRVTQERGLNCFHDGYDLYHGWKCYAKEVTADSGWRTNYPVRDATSLPLALNLAANPAHRCVGTHPRVYRTVTRAYTLNGDANIFDGRNYSSDNTAISQWTYLGCG